MLADTTALAGIVTAPICHKVWKDASSFPAHFSPAVGATASEKRADAPVGVAIGRIVVVGIAIVVGIAEPTTGSNRNQLTPCKINHFKSLNLLLSDFRQPFSRPTSSSSIAIYCLYLSADTSSSRDTSSSSTISTSQLAMALSW